MNHDSSKVAELDLNEEVGLARGKQTVARIFGEDQQLGGRIKECQATDQNQSPKKSLVLMFLVKAKTIQSEKYYGGKDKASQQY